MKYLVRDELWPAFLALLIVLSGVSATHVNAQAVNPAQWGRSVEISVSGYQGGSALTDFPLLVSLDPASLPGFDYGECNPDGSDLRFTNEDNTELLDHEIELWNSSGTSLLWVRVPSLVPNRVIKAFWKNSAAGSLPSTGVWNSGFSGVWHLADSLNDSTANANNGTNTGSVETDGVVSGARAFDGNDFIDCGNGYSLNQGNNKLTLSAWIKPNSFSGNCIVSKSYNAAHSSPYYTWVLYTPASPVLHCRIDSSAASKGTLSAGVWQHVSAAYNGSAVNFYINGYSVGSFAKSSNILVTDRNVRIGGRHTSTLGEFFNGTIDEVRVSSVARSADWIKAEHDTVADAGFCTFGVVEDSSIPKLTVADAQCVEGNNGTTQLVFAVNLSVPPTNSVSFHYATSFGSADAGDATAVEGELTIPSGEVQALITLSVTGDLADEPDETLYLDLSAVNGAVAVKPRGYALILDDDGSSQFSPFDITADEERRRIYVARYTDNSIAVIDAREDSLIQAFALPEAPNSLTLNGDGSLLYVAAGGSDGHVYVLDSMTGAVLQTIDAGHTPMAPNLSPDEKTLYLCNRFNNDVSVINLSDGSTVARIPVARQPVAAALSIDGSKLFVAEHLPFGAATNNLYAAAVSVIDTVSRTISQRIVLPPGSQSLRGLCISADGSTVYATHLVSHFQIPTTQILRGWMNTAALSVIDVATASLVGTVLLDDLDLGAANPWDVICSADNSTLCVSHAGTHEVSVIDHSALLTELQSADAETSIDFSYLIDLRRRLPLKGNGPRGLALVGTKLYAAQYFSDTIGVVDTLPGNEYSAQEIEAGVPRTPDIARRGERNYNDAMLCLQQWQSCASCHPDARADALNWDLLNDGFGNPKNTKSHVFSMQTPPAMVTGIRANSQVAVRAGLKYIQFVNRDESYALDIDAYLTALQPTPSPYLINGALSPAAVRGQALFSAQNCTGCHSGPYFTDQNKHDIGSGIGRNAGVQFDTPTLRELWRSGPYLHDGRIDNVRDVVTEIHGSRVSGLTLTQIDDLVDYLLSL